jgi:hypothetical protein
MVALGRLAGPAMLLIAAGSFACSSATEPAAAHCPQAANCFTMSVRGMIGTEHFDSTVVGTTRYLRSGTSIRGTDTLPATAAIDLYPSTGFTLGGGYIFHSGDSAFVAGTYAATGSPTIVEILGAGGSGISGTQGTLTISSVRGDTIEGTFFVTGYYVAGGRPAGSGLDTLSGTFSAVGAHR